VTKTRPDEFLARVGRLIAARRPAQQITRHEYGPPAAEDEDDGDEDDEPASYGDRPTVVGRDHPSWAEIDAEQRERIGEPPGEDGPSMTARPGQRIEIKVQPVPEPRGLTYCDGQLL
jgi:hypothetical protein